MFLPSAATAAIEPPLYFEVKEGLNLNCFLRDGPVAAHLLLRSGRKPRILAAFPAGNSGDGLWFEPIEGTPEWTLVSVPRAETIPDALGRPLYGITAEAGIATPKLVPQQAVLSSVRLLRDYAGPGTVPSEILVAPARQANRLVWSRNRLDGAPGYRLSLDVIGGSLTEDGRILAGPDGRIKLRIGAFSGETPLTPIGSNELLGKGAANDRVARDALAFLSYEEKLLAGSWRFNTYFGRDTLLSVRLLLPVLAPKVVEAGLSAVVGRLSNDGEVAHEEEVGEFAVLNHLRKEGRSSDSMILDYGMIDGDFILAPVLAAYLLDATEGRRRADDFLARSAAGSGERIGRALTRNLLHVVATTGVFARNPEWQNLVRLKPGRMTGQWRDSDEGLGRGIYPFDVNAVFVPAALTSIARLLDSSLLASYINPDELPLLARAGEYAKIWQDRAAPLFDVTLTKPEAQKMVEAYAKSLKVGAEPALASLQGDTVQFHAVSLDETGKAVPIVNSDEGFALLFCHPPPAEVDRAVEAMMRPFPSGLMTEAGLLVANPVFAGKEAQARLSNSAYHGTVIWSWQQALLAAGLDRQLKRADLPGAVRERLLASQQKLQSVIDANRVMRTSELWTWRYQDGRFVALPFGVGQADEDESNAAQLWSTVYLAEGSGGY